MLIEHKQKREKEGPNIDRSTSEIGLLLYATFIALYIGMLIDSMVRNAL